MAIRRLPLILAAVAFASGLAAWLWFLDRELVLSHYDAKAHLVVARRVIDNITPGWKQIGAVWLPLPHLIQVLPTQVDLFYRTGAFGSLLSIASFAALVWAASRLVLALTSSATGAIAAGTLLVLNPNLLYLQATPMTEPLLLASVFVSIAWLYEWLQTAGPAKAEHYDARLGWALFAAAWTRYEAWLIIAVALDIAWYVLMRSGLGFRRATTIIMRLAAWPAAAVLLFAVNSRLTTGSWLVTGGFYEIDPTYHGLVIKSLIAVWWGTHRLSGYLVEAVGLLAAGWLLWQAVVRREWSARLLPVAFLAATVLPFYGFLEGHPFRVRYMVVPAAACALLCGIAVGLLRNRAAALLLTVLVAASLTESPPWNMGAPMIEEARWDLPRTIARRDVTACFIRQYRHDKILASMGSLAHYMQELSVEGLRIADFIHEGNGELWTLALSTGPAPHAGWMIVEEQSEGGDVLARRVREDATFARGMSRVCAGGGVAVYRRE